MVAGTVFLAARFYLLSPVHVAQWSLHFRLLPSVLSERSENSDFFVVQADFAVDFVDDLELDSWAFEQFEILSSHPGSKRVEV